MARKRKRKKKVNPFMPGYVIKFSSAYWLLYSLYKGIQDLYSKKGKGKKSSKILAILSIIFPLLLLWAFYGPSKEED